MDLREAVVKKGRNYSDNRKFVGRTSLAMSDAVNYLQLLDRLIDDGGDWALQMVKDQKKIRKTIQELEIMKRELNK